MIDVKDDWKFELKLDAWLAEHAEGRRVMKSAVKLGSDRQAVFPVSMSIGRQYRMTQDALRIGLAIKVTASGFILSDEGYFWACRMAS